MRQSRPFVSSIKQLLRPWLYSRLCLQVLNVLLCHAGSNVLYDLIRKLPFDAQSLCTIFLLIIVNYYLVTPIESGRILDFDRTRGSNWVTSQIWTRFFCMEINMERFSSFQNIEFQDVPRREDARCWLELIFALYLAAETAERNKVKAARRVVCKFMVIREEKLMDDGERSTYVFLKAFRWDSKKQGKQLGEELHVLE